MFAGLIKSRLSLLLMLVTAFTTKATAAEQPNSATADPLAIYREAGATTDQESKIRQLASEYERSAKVRLQRIRNLSTELKAESFSAELDEKKIINLQEEMNSLHAGLCLDRIKLMLNIRQVLDSDQRAKLVSLMKEKGLGTVEAPR